MATKRSSCNVASAAVILFEPLRAAYLGQPS